MPFSKISSSSVAPKWEPKRNKGFIGSLGRDVRGRQQDRDSEAASDGEPENFEEEIRNIPRNIPRSIPRKTITGGDSSNKEVIDLIKKTLESNQKAMDTIVKNNAKEHSALLSIIEGQGNALKSIVDNLEALAKMQDSMTVDLTGGIKDIISELSEKVGEISVSPTQEENHKNILSFIKGWDKAMAQTGEVVVISAREDVELPESPKRYKGILEIIEGRDEYGTSIMEQEEE